MSMARTKRTKVTAPAAPNREATPHTPREGRFDLWLQRASHISQFGLFLFSIGTIYFTVIPLYQKALLDEQIARKEADLIRTQGLLDAAQSKVRLSFLGTFVFNAGAECSGLLVPPPPMAKLGDDLSKRETYAKKILAINPVQCMNDVFASSLLKQDLGPQDLAIVQNAISRIASELEKSRQKALARYENAGGISFKPNAQAALDPSTQSMFEVLRRVDPSLDYEALLMQAAISKEQASAAEDYSKEVRSKISELRNLHWNEGR